MKKMGGRPKLQETMNDLRLAGLGKAAHDN